MSMAEPKALREGWAYFEDGEIILKEDAPEWAKKEIAEFNRALKREPEDDGSIIVR